MKAIVYTEYGPPDVLQLKEVAKPTPKADEVLIQVHAASVNAADWHLLSADIFLVRLMGGLAHAARSWRNSCVSCPRTDKANRSGPCDLRSPVALLRLLKMHCIPYAPTLEGQYIIKNRAKWSLGHK